MTTALSVPVHTIYIYISPSAKSFVGIKEKQSWKNKQKTNVIFTGTLSTFRDRFQQKYTLDGHQSSQDTEGNWLSTRPHVHVFSPEEETGAPREKPTQAQGGTARHPEMSRHQLSNPLKMYTCVVKVYIDCAVITEEHHITWVSQLPCHFYKTCVSVRFRLHKFRAIFTPVFHSQQLLGLIIVNSECVVWHIGRAMTLQLQLLFIFYLI